MKALPPTDRPVLARPPAPARARPSIAMAAGTDNGIIVESDICGGGAAEAAVADTDAVQPTAAAPYSHRSPPVQIPLPVDRNIMTERTNFDLPQSHPQYNCT